ncbi:hypothetical protein pb186bvf_002735 [Paramecium bursaria]
MNNKQKAVVPTYFPSERPMSGGKENRVRQVSSVSIQQDKNHSSSFKITEPSEPKFELEIKQLKSQMTQMQQDQSLINNKHAHQIQQLNDKMFISEQQILQQKLDFESNEQKNVNSKINDIQNQLQQYYDYTNDKLNEQSEILQNYISEIFDKYDIIQRSQIQQLQVEIEQINMSLRNPQPYSNDVQKFERFNNDVSNYLLNRQIIPQEQQFSMSPTRKIKNIYKSEMSAIVEKSLEESIIEQQTQFVLDENGYLISDGQFLRDEKGQKLQLTKEQIIYLKSINVLEELQS